MKWIYRSLLGVSIALMAVGWADEIRPKGTSSSYQIVTGDDAEDDKRHWDRFFDTRSYVFGREPSTFLRDHIDKLPMGRVLDIAMGEGRNAVFLAKKGYSVEGVDFSPMAVRKAKRLARDNQVTIKTITADLTKFQIQEDAYTVILNINYLQRGLIGEIKRGVKKGGVVVFEAFTTEQLENPGGKNFQKAFLLKKGELRELFRDFKILVYRETNDGKSAIASLIAAKP